MITHLLQRVYFQTIVTILENSGAARQPPLHRKDSSTAGS